jgi:diguanylate cyclase (GGDEF)-like protein
MMALWSALSAFSRRLFPPVPAEIADEYALMNARRLLSQTRLLFAALFVTVPPTFLAASPTAPAWVRIGLPFVMGAACIAGFLFNRSIVIGDSIRRARWFIARVTTTSVPLAFVCSSWCVVSWWTASAETRAYYPLILAMGSLGTGYCLSGVRTAAVLNVAVGMLPIAFLMFVAGDRFSFAAGTSLLVATFFLLHVIIQQHAQLVDILLIKRQLRCQAETDPLTGLLNRRALHALIDEKLTCEDAEPFIVALIDLDGFKPINDRHGHAAGDRLLCEAAERLRELAGASGVAARLGGDEFAVLVDSVTDDNLAGRIARVLAKPVVFEGQTLKVGASVGVAAAPLDGACVTALLEIADRRLYAVKASRGRRRTDRVSRAA